MRVLVCGGRNYRDRDHIWNTLCQIDEERGPISCIIHGAGTGSDAEGAVFARELTSLGEPIEECAYAADWKTYGRAAGPIRNAQMLADGKPDLVVAFPGGRGTADMVAKARAAGVEVIECA